MNFLIVEFEQEINRHPVWILARVILESDSAVVDDLYRSQKKRRAIPMKSLLAVLGTVLLLGLVVGLGTARQVNQTREDSVEVAVLSEATWNRFVAEGKEVDAIYGDIALRNGFVTAVIAQPIATRHANMTVRDVAGALIDLAVQSSPNDQLAAFYPGKKRFAYRAGFRSKCRGQRSSPRKAASVSEVRRGRIESRSRRGSP